MKIRKNAALLTAEEWERYCRAVVALKHTPARGSSVSVYDQFVATHLCVTSLHRPEGDSRRSDGAHGVPEFLSWHREYLRRYEAALAAVDPRVTLPYWNWGLGAESETDGLFEDDRMGRRPTVPSASTVRYAPVPSGYFSAAGRDNLGWTIHDKLRALGNLALQRLERQPFARLPTREQVLEILEMDDYEDLRRGVTRRLPNGKQRRIAGLERMHGIAHGWVGGDMGPFTSPNDPIFFMLHAQVDRIWAIWQRTNPGTDNYPEATLRSYMWPWDGGESSVRDEQASAAALLPTLSPDDVVSPADVLDTKALGYIYDGEDARWELGKTEESVDHNWSRVHLGSRYGRSMVVVACLDSFVGADTAAVRVRSRAGDHDVDFMVEEEQSRDAELEHAKEAVGYLVGEEGLIHDGSGRIAVGEMGATRVRQTGRDSWERVVFQHSYRNPVVIATVSSYFGSHPSHARIREVTGESFSVCIEEWKYLDDYHTTEDVSYLVVEEGDHSLPDGSRMVAGRTAADHGWKRVEFDTAFAHAPVVLSQCMSVEGGDPVVTRQREVQAGSFEVRLQEEEALDGGGHIEETVGYIAFGA